MTSEAFSLFYKKWYNMCYEYACSLIHDKNDSQDIVQDCFMRLYYKYDDAYLFGENHSKDGKGVLLTSIRNASLDYLRRLDRTRKIFKYVQVDELFLSEEDSINLIEMRVIQLIHEKIEEFSFRKKIIFKMHWSGMKSIEIAGKLNIPRQTVLNQKADAVNDLKNYIKKII
jgi:RNA polymerase sigma factor (sigma-70 family)